MTNYEKLKEEQLKNPDVRKEYDALEPKFGKIRKRLKRISDKRKVQLIKERELTQKLYKLQGGRCAECGNKLGWRSAKHEIIFRSQGGDATDENNCQLLCGKCHSKRHGIKEV